jgi:predicted regulator of Ras-like GTPase activity (Roadblock/LC7/MglB family)
MVWPVPGSSHDLALRYLLELSADIRGALLLDRDGRLLATAGHLPPDDLSGVAGRLAEAARALSPDGDGQPAIEVDVFSEGGVMFLLAEGELLMSCVTNRGVHPGLIFYDMHAVLRDLDRAAAAEAIREGGRR